MDRSRFEFLKKVAARFRENPEATECFGVSRQTCFSLLAYQFSAPEGYLDPTEPDFLDKMEERIGLHESRLAQNQPPPKTLEPHEGLETAAREWQEEVVRQEPTPQPARFQRIGRFFEGKLKKESLKAWGRVSPKMATKIGRFLGKGKLLAKLAKFGRLGGAIAAGSTGIGLILSLALIIGPKRILKLLKGILKLMAGALIALYYFLLSLGMGALVGAAVGAAIGGFIAGPAGAAAGALIGGAVGYGIEHFAIRPLSHLVGGTQSFLGGLWSGITTGAGNLLGGALSWLGGAAEATGSFVANIGGSLSSVSLANAATGPLLATTGVATIGTFWLGTSIVGTGFMRPPNLSEGGPVLSQYIRVEKSVSPKNSFESSELPTTVTYTLTITALAGKLLNVGVNDQTTVTKEGSAPTVPPRSWTIPEIATSWSQSYDLGLTTDFLNSAVTNVVSVIADVEGGPAGETAVTSVTITIGSPPEDCPSGWPTDEGYLTQGPNTRCPDDYDAGRSHCNLEAVDIGVAFQPVYATHKGTASILYTSCRGNYVEIVGICGGKEITSRYLHLETIEIGSGLIGRGTRIGVSGNTGSCTTGPHLHYQFYDLPMGAPYIPVSRESIFGCDSVMGCGVSW